MVDRSKKTAEAGAFVLPESASLLVSDVDNTLTGDDVAMAELARLLQAHGDRVVLAMNSSRPAPSVRASFDAVPNLPVPAIIIGAMGTQIERFKPAGPLGGFESELKESWDRNVVHETAIKYGLTPHHDEFQTPLKASYHCEDAGIVGQIERDLLARNVRTKIVYSSGRDLDLLAPGSGKRAAIHWLARYLRIGDDRVLVSGDSENDLDMFDPAFRGIVVANATPGLLGAVGPHVYRARQNHAAGVIEGLRHFQVLPN